MKRRKRSFERAFTAFILVGAFTLCSGMFAFLYYSHLQESQRLDPAFTIRFLSHEGDLPSDFLEELLGLSVDKPFNIHEFDTSEAEKKLRKHPIIRSAKVSKTFPDSCQVKYSFFQPAAVLADWENAAIDPQGRLIPLKPFFSDLGLPRIVLGFEKDIAWGERLQMRRVRLALEVLESLPLHELLTLDVSRADLPSFGKREIIVTLTRAVLRLNPDDWRSGWKNYLKMQHLFFEDAKLLAGGNAVGSQEGAPFALIDLRVQQIALLRMFSPPLSLKNF